MSVLARVLVILVLVIVLALVLRSWRGVAGRVAGRVAGGGEPWWAEPLAPRARAAVRQYARRNFVPTLRGSDRAAFDKALRRATGAAGAKKSDLVALQTLLRRGSLKDTGAGTGEGRRADSRAAKIVNLIPSDAGVETILDIGCGDGSITAAIARQLKAESRTACAEPRARPASFPKHIGWVTEEADGGLPIPDASCDLTLALMSLHHADPAVLPRLVSEIGRVTGEGKTFILREHDLEGCGSLKEHEARQFIDWSHILYDLAEGVAVDRLDRSHYRSRAEWNALLAPDFELVSTTGTDRGVCSYYAVYRRR